MGATAKVKTLNKNKQFITLFQPLSGALEKKCFGAGWKLSNLRFNDPDVKYPNL